MKKLAAINLAKILLISIFFSSLTNFANTYTLDIFNGATNASPVTSCGDYYTFSLTRIANQNFRIYIRENGNIINNQDGWFISGPAHYDAFFEAHVISNSNAAFNEGYYVMIVPSEKRFYISTSPLICASTNNHRFCKW